MKVDKVLVPLDGSPLAEKALPTAIELLRDSPDGTLVLLPSSTPAGDDTTRRRVLSRGRR